MNATEFDNFLFVFLLNCFNNFITEILCVFPIPKGCILLSHVRKLIVLFHNRLRINCLFRSFNLQFIEHVRSVSSKAMIGHRLGVPTIFVQDKISDEDFERIEKLVKQHRVADCDIIKTSEIRWLNSLALGSKFESTGDRYGTVGGLALYNDRQPCALLCDHVVKDVSENTNVKIAGKQFKVQGHSLLKCDPKYDIAALVMETDTDFGTDIELDGTFKTPNGIQKPCSVFKFEDQKYDDYFDGMHVFFRGAKTTLGRGIVTSTDMSDGVMQNYMQFEGVEENETPFCQPGDSGAIVCFEHENGIDIKALAMLQGAISLPGKENETDLYNGIRLENSLSALSEKHGRIDLVDYTFQRKG